MQSSARPFFAALFLSFVLPPVSSHAIVLPAGFTEFAVATGLSDPTAMAFAPDGRLFVSEQAGRVRVIKNGALLPTPFATVPTILNGDLGLIGVAFDPAFATNSYVYVYYTATRRLDGTEDLHHRVSRFTASGDVAVPGSERVLLEILDDSPFEWHTGGGLRFARDGKLLITVGDRSRPIDSQSLGTFTGKILRMNPDGTIPTDNPFYGTATGPYRLIWGLGLRNPFTLDVQPGTGRVFINDVGTNLWEEINDGIAGANYGYPASEGPTSDPAYRSPIYAYDHSVGCSIVGAAFYNPPSVTFPAAYVGRYFFGDYCARFIKMLDPTNGNAVTDFATQTEEQLVDLETGLDGALYYLSRIGVVRRIAYTSSSAPSITSQPADQTISVGQPVTFSVTASGTPPLGYQWQRNQVDIAGATSPSYRIGAVTMADDGALFRCRVSNVQGSTLSREAMLSVTSNQPPQATIDTPAPGSTYAGGQTLLFSGHASDPEDGTLPAGAFTWRIDFHHDTHIHPEMPATTGSTSGSFTVWTRGETSTNVWFRIHLSVVDSGGLRHDVYRDVLPRVVRLTLATQPTGLGVSLDGQGAQTAPYSIDAVVGLIRSIGTPATQTMNGRVWQFASWSDGGAPTHDVTVPASATTWTALFNETDARPTPTPTAGGPRRYEQNDAAVRYGGVWFSNTNGVHSGGTAALAMDAGRDVTFTFSGTGIAWIGLRDPWSGMADVYLDGVSRGRIDTYAATQQARTVLFVATGLPAGSHTIRVFVPGARSAASGGNWVWIDAFDVTDGVASTPTPTPTATATSTATPTPTSTPSPTPRSTATPTAPTPTPGGAGRYEQNDATARYGGTWFTNTNGVHSGGTAAQAMDAGSDVTFTFSGTGISWIGLRDPWSGLADVYLDGVSRGRIDTYAAAQQARTVIFSATGLPAGSHTIRVFVPGARGAASGGNWVWIDAFDVSGGGTPTATPTPAPTTSPSGRYEQNDAAVRYGGPWFTNTNGVHSGGTAALAMDTGSDVTFTFSGTGIAWIGLRDPWSGMADVYLDGISRGRIDAYAATQQARTVIFSASGLSPGSHTIRIFVPGARSAASGGNWVWVDAFDVVNGS